MRFWLIQRAVMEKSVGKKGLDSLIRLDYMGSAEFEFGDVPRSLKRVRADAASYTMTTLKIREGKVLTICCKPDQEKEVKAFLKTCCSKEYEPRLKERPELYQWANPEKARWKCRNNFWWDIVNDWFAWEENLPFQVDFRGMVLLPPAV